MLARHRERFDALALQSPVALSKLARTSFHPKIRLGQPPAKMVKSPTSTELQTREK
jgi:hypothetical protein